jgi:4-diphosphocytidyl-2-C-methyl-D-erythritol kinase
VTVRVPAKVNLHLAVGDLRDDGYHGLTTVFQALSLTDEVSVTPAEELGIEIHGEGAAILPVDETNLAWKATMALAEHVGRDLADSRVHIVIRKGIPVAGGMAGGSADAAATLVALSALWKLDIGRDELATIAGTLGSDVPFMLHGGTALGTSRGEQLVPVLSRHTFHWVIALDSKGLSTPEVYGEIDRLRAAGRQQRLGAVEPLLEALAAGVSLRPNLRRTLRAGVDAGALAGLICGSGPTCAFLCADADTAVRVAAELAGAGVCRTVRAAHGPVPGARVITDDIPRPVPPEVHA